MYESHVQDQREAQEAGLRTAALVFFDLLTYIMFLLRPFAPCLLLLLLLGLQVSVSSCARSKSRGADRTVTAAAGTALKSGNKPAASGRGKFTIKGNMQCTWGAKDVGDAVRLSVTCEDLEARARGGVTDLRCEYNGKPQSCPGYQSDTKGYWKQVARAFKRLQGKVCQDSRALVKAGMCKRAPRDAHFKLDISSAVVSAQSGGPETTTPPPPPPPPPRANSTDAPPAATTACSKRADHRRTAEESCSGAWASVCNFFLSMLQSDDC